MVARQVLTLKIEVRVLAGEPAPYRWRGLLLSGVVLPLFAVLFSACSVSVSGGAPSQLDVEVRNASRVFMDPQTERDSEAIRSYIVGQLAFQDQNLDDAITNFSRASDLVSSPVPLLHSRLAELYVRRGELDNALAETEKAIAAEPSERSNRLLRAGILEVRDRNDEAQAMYEQLLAETPGDSDTTILLAGLYEKQKKYDKALALMDELVARNPKVPLGYFYRGRILESKGELDAALKNLLVAYSLEPKSDQIQADVVRVMAKKQDVPALQKFCEELLKANPENLLARKVLGHVLLGKSEFDQALSHLQVLEEKEVDPVDTRFKIALIQIQKQNFREAYRELNLVLAQKPEFEEARYNLAALLGGSGQIQEAVAELDKIKPEQSLYEKANTFAAYLLRQTKDYAGAEERVRKVLAVSPHDVQAINYLILVLRDNKKFEEARDFVEEVLEADPKNERMLFNLAVILHDLDQKPESLRVMDQVLELNPENSDALNYVAYGLAEEGRDLERAYDLIQRALKLRPDDGYYLDTLGWVFFKSNRPLDAEEVLNRAVHLAGDDPDILEHYAEVLEVNGKAEQALETYKSLVELLHDSKQHSDSERLERIRLKIEHLQSESSAVH